MKRINFILPSIGKSGGVNVVLKYATELKKIGWDVLIYVPQLEYDLKRSYWLKNKVRQILFTAKNIKVSTQYKDNKFIKFVPTVSNKYIRNADVTIATAWPTAFSVNNLDLSKGKKVYFIQDYETWDNERLGKASYLLPLFHITIAGWIDKRLVQQLNCDPSDVIFNGIDTNFFKPQDNKKISKHIKCLMLYHTLPKKGINDGIKAFELAKKKYPQLELNMFGIQNDPHINAVEKYYQNPSRKLLLKLYQSSDIFIFPSREEGWGLTPIEAMSCGCAVAGTNVGCMLEIGENGVNALVSKAGDINALSNNIKQLTRNRKLREKIEENARITAKKLSWNKSTKKFNKILLDIINQ